MKCSKGVLVVTSGVIQEEVHRGKKAEPSTCDSICDPLPASVRLSSLWGSHADGPS